PAAIPPATEPVAADAPAAEPLLFGAACGDSGPSRPDLGGPGGASPRAVVEPRAAAGSSPFWLGTGGAEPPVPRGGGGGGVDDSSSDERAGSLADGWGSGRGGG